MGIKTWKWEKSLHKLTVISKHLQKALIAFKFICGCLVGCWFFCFSFSLGNMFFSDSPTRKLVTLVSVYPFPVLLLKCL